MSRILTALMLGALLVCTSCSGSSSSEGNPMDGAMAAGVLNLNCPIQGEPVDEAGGTVSYKGNTIGFCCKKCVAKFDAMSDAEKVAALAKVGTKLP
jgi:YHS domain-containing protein